MLSRTIEALSKLKVSSQVISHRDYGRKAEDVAPVLGVPKEGVLRTLTFIGKESGKPMIVLLEKSKEVDEGKLSAFAGEEMRLAKAPEVLKLTGTEIGGVTPIGSAVTAVIDKGVLGLKKVLLPAGEPESSVLMEAGDLQKACPGARLESVSR